MLRSSQALHLTVCAVLLTYRQQVILIHFHKKTALWCIGNQDSISLRPRSGQTSATKVERFFVSQIDNCPNITKENIMNLLKNHWTLCMAAFLVHRALTFAIDHFGNSASQWCWARNANQSQEIESETFPTFCTILQIVRQTFGFEEQTKGT